MPAFNTTSVEIIDLPDFSKLPEGLPHVLDSMSLAHALGIRNRTLMHAVINRKDMYTQYTIPKKSGGTRSIHAPNSRLKYIQGKVLSVFLDQLDYPAHVGAYVKNRTTRDTAAVHAGKPLLIVIDLKDFFPSTRRSWLRRYMQQSWHMPYKVASLLSDLMTVPVDFPYGRRYVVPQGAPTSGAICNLVADARLDVLVMPICEKYGMAYTRYADDLAFSHAERLVPAQTDVFIKEISQAIRKAGYTVNRKKLRVARSGRQQRLLGMTINERPNIMRLQSRRLRACLHQCRTKGFEAVAKAQSVESGAKLESHVEGLIAYYHMINPNKAAQFKEDLDKARVAQANV